MRNVKVHIAPFEALQAGEVGFKRGLYALYGNKRNINNTWDDERFARTPFWGKTIESAIAELAVAKVLGTYLCPTLWATPPSPKQPDIEPDIEVRWISTYAKHSDCIVRTTDIPTQKVVSVVGSLPDYVVRGWIGVEEAWKHEELFEGRGVGDPVFWIPESMLHDLDDLVVHRGIATEPVPFDDGLPF